MPISLENKKQGGLVVAESERVVFDGRDGRCRAVLVDLTRTKVVSADDFPESDDVARGGYSNSGRGTGGTTARRA